MVMRCKCLLVACCLAAFTVFADVVHVYEQTEAGGVRVQIADRMLDTGRNYKTGAAPVKSGWIFTHWTISTEQDFDSRDVWGRAYDEAPFKLYEETTLTAHYLPKTQDTDGDGFADGNEIYWYGSTDVSPSSDTDGDGFTFSEEIANGTNPLMADLDIEGPIKFVDGALNLYNPSNYGAVVIRSEPEGALFTTLSEVYRPGVKMATTSKGTYNPSSTKFAYWSFNGVRQADVWGRAVDSMGVITDGRAMEIIAVAATDYETRMKLYWYGDASVAMTSDTDGDGLTFAQELANGSNPLMADGDIEGPVKFADGEKLQYNPYDYQPYTLMSDPEGVLFPTTNFYVRGGTKVNIGTQGSSFTYWKLNGVEQRDAWGRAMDALSFRMPSEAVTVVAKSTADYETRMKLYWYGTTEVEMASDTDGDGLTFAQELANGSNPLMTDGDIEGPVRYADTQLHEANLQPYEQVFGAVVDEVYEEFPMLGGAVTPTIVDIDGDGKLDIVVEAANGETIVYLGCGSEGNPEFVKTVWRSEWAQALAAARPRSLDGLEFDVKPPTDRLSWSFAYVDRDGVEDMLMSDSEGRIWYYKGIAARPESAPYQLPTTNYQLQHKVWGGSFAGFAEELRIAAVDWDDDGDLDCLCGTAEGKLMLLRDPKVGRPTNLRAFAGVDNVLLTWDPNAQSRIRGYRVYRDAAVDGAQETRIAEPQLPTYRDYPPEIADYDYKVSGVSRFYTAGNSTPVESESMATEAVRVSLGKVAFRWSNAAGFVGDEIVVSLGVDNSLNLSGAGLSLKVSYDKTALIPLRVETSGLTEDVAFTQSASDGQWTVSATGGEIAAGRGTFLSFVFSSPSVVTTGVALVSATLTSVGGLPVPPIMPETDARVEIAVRTPDEPPEDPTIVVPYSRGDVDGNGRLEKADLDLLAKLMNGGPNHKWSDDQLNAGDYNNNGTLDQDDRKLMKDEFRKLGIVNGGVKLEVLE